MNNTPEKWSIACHLDYGDRSAVAVVKYAAGETEVRAIPVTDAAGGEHPPVFLGVTRDEQVIMMDAESKAVSRQAVYPERAFAPYAYHAPDGGQAWYTNDGDEETGNDALNCGSEGASLTIVQGDGANGANILKTLCVGRGHHVTTFVAPSKDHPKVPHRVFASNLLDGTISVIGNDPADASTYLHVVTTINLCEPEKEDDGVMIAPNNAYPHGQVYSPVTGKIYNLNNGYRTVAVIDPVTCEIENRIPMKVSSNLLLSTCGRFLIGKGADRKADPDHVMGRLSVLDVEAGEVCVSLDLKDVYPSTYRFNPDGTRLYVTTAATGKGAQRDYLKKDLVYVYDTSALPKISLIKEIRVGEADCGRRPIAFLRNGAVAHRIFVPNPSEGTLSILDGAHDTVLETVRISQKAVKEVNFALLNGGHIYGC